MLEENTFARADTVPSWFANAIQRFLSVGAFSLQVVATDATHVKVPAGVGDQAAVVAVAGMWRWQEADVGPIAHPGGVAGLYPVFVTAKNNSIVSTPLPFTDATDRSFGLQIKAPGQVPTIVAGTVDQYRHVADITWDGAKIMGINQLVPKPPASTADGQPGDLIPSHATSRAGAVLCDGSAYVLASHPEMNALAANCPGLVSGGTLTVPDYRGRTMLGAGTGSGLTARTLGQTGGTENETAPLPAHSHTITDPTHSHVANAYAFAAASGSAVPAPGPPGFALGAGTISPASTGINGTNPAGSGGSHNNVPPFLVVNIFIKL